jgi:hypothetical protein
MSNLFVLTASNSEAYQHYIDTIEKGFTLDSIKDFLTPAQVNAIHNIYGDRLIQAWGATPGPGNIRTWDSMSVGDSVLIYRQGNFEYYALVTFKMHIPKMAEHLWQRNKKGETWEYIYLLDKLTEISVPVKVFNKIFEYKDNSIPQGFRSVNEDKTQGLKTKYGSIESFLNYLAEGKWVEKDPVYSKEVKEKIIQERVARQIGKTPLLEANLENFLADRVDQIEPGMKLIARQLDTGIVGRLDLLCEDKDGTLVVVELKKGAAGSSIIDQITRYMGWVMVNKARPNQRVRGIIIVGTSDTVLEYAVKASPLITVKVFNIGFVPTVPTV